MTQLNPHVCYKLSMKAMGQVGRLSRPAVAASPRAQLPASTTAPHSFLATDLYTVYMTHCSADYIW